MCLKDTYENITVYYSEFTDNSLSNSMLSEIVSNISGDFSVLIKSKTELMLLIKLIIAFLLKTE